MDKKTFDNLSAKALHEGIEACNTSMGIHYNAAIRLAEQKLWGSANSHLILCTEEGIKSAIFLFRILGIYDPSESVIKSLFSKHEIKHKLGKAFYSMIFSAYSFSMTYLMSKNLGAPKIENWDFQINNLTTEALL
jgi:hypothetical protein